MQVLIESLANKEPLLFESQWVRSESLCKPCEGSGAMANTAGSFNICGSDRGTSHQNEEPLCPRFPECVCPSNRRRANKNCEKWVPWEGTDYQATNRQKSDRSCSIGDRHRRKQTWPNQQLQLQYTSGERIQIKLSNSEQ